MPGQAVIREGLMSGVRPRRHPPDTTGLRSSRATGRQGMLVATCSRVDPMIHDPAAKGPPPVTTITTINPATKEAIASYDLMSESRAFEKVEACHAAFLHWRTKTHEERAPLLRDTASALRANADALSALMTKETGKLLRDGRTEVELCAQLFEYAAEHGPTLLADEERTHSGGKKSGVVAYCPIGVVYSIQPWNFPVYQPVRVLASSLMAGNGVILKHASICTGSGLMLSDVCLEEGLP